MTKRRVQGGEATSERRRRDGVYQKSARRTRAVLLPNHWRRARVSRASHAWRVRAAKDKVKVGSFTAPHDFSHTTRANIAHEEAEQIRARIVCTPAEKRWAGVGLICALTKARIFASLLPLEKALQTHQPNFIHIFVLRHSVKVVKGRHAQFCFKRNKASCQPSPAGEGGAVYRDG